MKRSDDLFRVLPLVYERSFGSVAPHCAFRRPQGTGAQNGRSSIDLSDRLCWLGWLRKN